MHVVDLRSRRLTASAGAFAAGLATFATGTATGSERWWVRLVYLATFCVVSGIVFARVPNQDERELEAAEPLPAEAVVVSEWSLRGLTTAALSLVVGLAVLAVLVAASVAIGFFDVSDALVTFGAVWCAVAGVGGLASARRTARLTRGSRRFYAPSGWRLRRKDVVYVERELGEAS